MSFDRILPGFGISASGLAAERKRIDVVAGNIANANATRTPGGGGAYRRRSVIFEAMMPSHEEPQSRGLGGVRVAGVSEDPSPLLRVFDPGHPDSDADGYVEMPNVNLPHEMVDMMTAKHAYEANLKALETFRRLAEQTLSLLRGV